MHASSSACAWLGSFALAAVLSAAACGQTGDTSQQSGTDPVTTVASTSTGLGGGLPSSTATGGAGVGVGGAAAGGAGVGGEPLPTTGITIQVEPNGGGSPLPAAIAAALTSVHMTMYILSDQRVIDALVHAYQAGRDVRVVLNQTFPDFTSSNQDAFDQLNNAHVPVHWASPVFTYTHEKAVVIDGTTAWIMTMNAASSSPDGNREYLAIDTIPEHVAETDAIFEGDYAGTPPATVSGPLIVAPLNAHAGIEAFIRTAKTSIDIEAEELTDETILDEILAAADAGVAVRVIIQTQNVSSTQTGANGRMKLHGVQAVGIYPHGSPTQFPYIHAKVLVVDRTAAYVGSANFTFYSLEANRELGVLFAVPSEIAKILATIDQDFGNATPL